MTRGRRTQHYTRQTSPIGTIANFGGKPFRMVTATNNQTQANNLAAKNNGKVERCTIDGAKSFSVWFPK